MLKLIAVGRIKEKHIQEGFCEYLKRIGSFDNLKVFEIKDSNMKEEGVKILKLLGDDYVVVLDVKGKELSSEELSVFLKKNLERKISFVIGGPEGLSEEVKERADYSLSLSRMTFTHEMARLFLSEQIYRAYTIMNGRSYHK